MGRVWLLAALLYGYGDPGFDGHRPELFDRQLQYFHRVVDGTANDIRRALVSFDDWAQSVRTIERGLRRLNDLL